MRSIVSTIAIMILAALAAASCSSATKKEFVPRPEHLLGKWEGLDHTGKQGAFQFSGDGNVMIIIDGAPLGGHDSGAFGRLTYTVDFSKSPIELDIIGIDLGGNVHGSLLMILSFLTPDSIKIRTFFNETRPADFDDESTDDTIILHRKPE